MKELPLTQGKVALVDDEDYENLNRFKWRAQKGKNGWYAVRWDYTVNPARLIRMHRVILGIEDLDYKVVQGDHKDGDGLNNQRSNLRTATSIQNKQNSKPSSGKSSRFKGVYWNKSVQRWIVTIQTDGLRLVVGGFTNEEKAAQYYDKLALQYFGKFARLNFPQRLYMP